MHLTFKPRHNRLSRYFQVNNWAAGMFVDHMLYEFRVNVPPLSSTRRRFARDVRDADGSAGRHALGLRKSV